MRKTFSKLYFCQRNVHHLPHFWEKGHNPKNKKQTNTIYYAQKRRSSDRRTETTDNDTKSLSVIELSWKATDDVLQDHSLKTLRGLILGWWGVISFLMTPFFIVNNIGRYLMSIGMDSVPLNARVPELNETIVQKMMPHAQSMIDAFNAGNDVESTVKKTALLAGVTPGEALLYFQNQSA